MALFSKGLIAMKTQFLSTSVVKHTFKDVEDKVKLYSVKIDKCKNLRWSFVRIGQRRNRKENSQTFFWASHDMALKIVKTHKYQISNRHCIELLSTKHDEGFFLFFYL